MAIDKENGAADNNGDGGDGGGGLMALMRRELDSFTTLTQEQQESACKRGYYIDDEQVQPRNNTEVKLSTMPVGDTWSLWISRSKSGAAHQNFLVSMVRFGEFHNRQSMELLLNELPDLLPLDDHTSYYMIRGRDGKPEWESEQHYLGGCINTSVVGVTPQCLWRTMAVYAATDYLASPTGKARIEGMHVRVDGKQSARLAFWIADACKFASAQVPHNRLYDSELFRKILDVTQKEFEVEKPGRLSFAPHFQHKHFDGKAIVDQRSLLDAKQRWEKMFPPKSGGGGGGGNNQRFTPRNAMSANRNKPPLVGKVG